MRGKNCIAIGSDKRFGVELYTVSSNMKKLFQINSHCILDVQTVKQKVENSVNLYELRHGQKIYPKTLTSMISSMMYQRRFGPWFVNPVVAGLDAKGEPFLDSMDSLGEGMSGDVPFVCAGTSDEQLFGMCESLFKDGMDPEELFEVVSQCLLASVDRDAIAGWGAEMWDRRTIEMYKESFEDEYDVITTNSNIQSEEHSTLLLSRGGFCQRICELLLPLLMFIICLVVLLYYFLNSQFDPKPWIACLVTLLILLSVVISVFSNSFFVFIWKLFKLPQHGFITGDILGLMILVRKGKNGSGARIKYVVNSAYAEVFSHQAAKKVWKLFGFVERFFIIKGYLSVDLTIDRKILAVTNTHLNTGTKNNLRAMQIKELFEKAITSNRPVILCGDTNAQDTQPEIKERMLDTYAVCRLKDEDRYSRGDGYTWHSDNPLTRQGFLIDENQRIDYIWFRTKAEKPDILEDEMEDKRPPMTKTEEDFITVRNAHVVLDKAPFVSDHFGVVAMFDINT